MRSSTFDLETRDGTPVHTYRWLPDDEVRAVVQIAHGGGEHAGRYQHVAGSLTAAGYAVYADDHRGHGRTAKTTDELGLFADERGWATVLDDLYRLNRTAHTAHPDVPIFLFGHSVGSWLTQQFLFTFPDAVDGAVLSGSTRALGPDVEGLAVMVRAEMARLGPRGRSAAVDTLVFGIYNRAFLPARTAFDWLSRDQQVVDEYIDDPLCGFSYTTKMWQDILSGMRVIRQTQRLTSIPTGLPIYVFSGDADPVGEAGRGAKRLVRAYGEAGMTNVSLKLYEAGRHEMVNETNRDEVIADLIGWLDQQVAAPST